MVMYQFRLPWDISWYDTVVEWLSDTVSTSSDNREFYSHLGCVAFDGPGPPRNPLFDNALVHYYSVVEQPLNMFSVVQTRWLRRAVGDGWNCFQLRHMNWDGYLECETLVIIYDEMIALQFKLMFPSRGMP
jgi:hypothetical protein